MHQQLTERTVDLDPRETAEWLEALDQIVDGAGPNRATFLIEKLTDRARENGVDVPVRIITDYVNTIQTWQETPYPGDRDLERRIKSLIRWNAMAMVVRANKYDAGIGGHISTYASLATLLKSASTTSSAARYGDQPGDLVYFQGHASPGIYARAFLEGRLTEEHLENFRHELRDTPGLSSYPHPWLMPDFWQFPTVSMGLGPINVHLPGALHALPGKPRPHRQRPTARSGPSSATAKPTSPNRSAPSRSLRAKSSTT